MKAVTYQRYGPVDVLNVEDVPTPSPNPSEVLIRVRAASVTTADWRIRALAMPGAMKLIGRLLFGIFGPRNKILGTDVAGDIVAVGENVSTFKVGDAVFGHIGKGGHAEYAVAQEHAAIIAKPASLSYIEAAALPFGALSALVFLRDFAKLNSHQRILITGASGNVGVYAVQIAKAFGAHVTAVACAGNAQLVSDLGADKFVDYQSSNPDDLNEKFDIVFDTYGSMSFAEARDILTEAGLFVPLNFSLGEALANLLSGWTRQQKMITAVNNDAKSDMLELADLIEHKKLKPIVDSTYKFGEIHNAYKHVEGRRRNGSIVLDVAIQSGLSK